MVIFFPACKAAGQVLPFSDVQLSRNYWIAYPCRLSQGHIGEALQELLLAEEAFELAPTELIEGVDNVALLMLDIVWYVQKIHCNSLSFP